MEMIFISWIFLAVVIGAVASTKEKSFGLWFLLSILLSPLVAGFCLVITLIPSKTGGLNEGLVAKDDFEEKWITLVKYDDRTKKAVEQLERYGVDAVEELKKVLRATNDHTRLPIAAEQIAKEFKIKIEQINQERAARETRKQQEFAAREEREIQYRVEAEKMEVAAQEAREIKAKIFAEKKIIWMKRGRYVLFVVTTILILLFTLNSLVPSEDTSTIVDNYNANIYNISGLSYISKGEYDLAMKDFKYISNGHYFAKTNYVYAFVLKHQRSTLHLLILLVLIVAVKFTYKNMVIRVKYYRYGLFVIMFFYICCSLFVVINDITESKRTATIAAEKEQRENSEREQREKVENVQRRNIKEEHKGSGLNS